LLAAGANADLRDLVGQPVFVLELADDRALQLWRSVDVGILGGAGVDGGLGRLLDVKGRIEIRLALRQADDVASLAAQFIGQPSDGNRRRRTDGRQSRREPGRLDMGIHARCSTEWR
jgi:hypothetical protein